jgi:hypothetical protein
MTEHGLIRRGALLAAAVALAAGILPLAPGLRPAQAATAPTWHAPRTVGPDSGVTDPAPDQGAAGLAVTGPRSAWSVWSSCSAPCPSRPVSWVERWNGRTWKRVAPAALAGLTQAVAVAASSAREAWLFNGPSDRTTALHWNGSIWSKRTIPSWVIRLGEDGEDDISAADFGATDLWVFSAGVGPVGSAQPFAAHFNGHQWTRARLPVTVDEVSAVSRNDIWTLGSTATGQSVVEHWNGKAWHALAVPRVKAPAGATEFVRDLMATGPRGLWLQRDLEKGSVGAKTLYLLHWNGKTWQRVSPHYPTSLVDNLARDGRGGIWMVANGPAPADRWYFYHRTSAARWSRQVLPAAAVADRGQVIGLAAVPGSTALFATGSVDLPHEGNGGVVGAIWRYAR